MPESPLKGRSDLILAAARKRFENFGFRHTSITDIADDAGVAAGTIYWHFESKEALFRRLIDAENADWLERARDALHQPGSALERLAMLARASTDFYQQSRLMLAVLRRDRSMIHAPLLDDIHARLQKQSVSLMAQLLQDGIQDGTVRSVDPEKAAYVLFSVGHALFNQSAHPYEDLADVLADIAVHGLAPRPEAA